MHSREAPLVVQPLSDPKNCPLLKHLTRPVAVPVYPAAHARLPHVVEGGAPAEQLVVKPVCWKPVVQAGRHGREEGGRSGHKIG